MSCLVPLLLLLAPAGACAGQAPYYVTVIKNGSCAGPDRRACLDESFKALEKMVQLADAQSVKLTLLFSDAYAQFVSSLPARAAEVQSWKNSGHEAGAWHRDSDRALLAGAPLPALAALAGNLRTACTGGAKAGDRARFEVCPSGGGGGVNRSLLSSAGGGRALRSYAPEGRAGVAAAKKDFSSMRGGVYAAAFTGEPGSFGAFYSWLAFLREADQFGGLSRTAAQALEGELLPAGKAAPRAVKSRVAETEPPQRAGERLAAKTPIPRLRPRPNPFSVVERLFFGPRSGRQGGPVRAPAVCGDGRCSYSERGGASPCPADCGGAGK